MKISKYLFVFGLFMLSIVSLNAQMKVDEILQNYIENTGGMEIRKGMENVKVEMKSDMMGMSFSGVAYRARPNKNKQIIQIMGKELIQAFDGETGWMINPFQGSGDPERMSDEMVEEMGKEQFEDEFINYKEKGHTVELLGEEEVDGVPTYKLKLTKEEGDEIYYYFDQENFVPIMQEQAIKAGPQEGKLAQTYMSDYLEIDNGLIMAHFIETKVDGQSMSKITMENVEINVELPEDFFDFPEKK